MIKKQHLTQDTHVPASTISSTTTTAAAKPPHGSSETKLVHLASLARRRYRPVSAEAGRPTEGFPTITTAESRCKAERCNGLTRHTHAKASVTAGWGSSGAGVGVMVGGLPAVIRPHHRGEAQGGDQGVAPQTLNCSRV